MSHVRWWIVFILFLATVINYVDRNVLSFTMIDEGFRKTMLGLPADAVSDRPLWVNTGSEQLVIPIATKELVRAAAPGHERLAALCMSPAREEAMAYLWAKGGPGEDDLVRFFFTLNGSVVEDPATGSACANLGGWHLATGQALPVERTLRQGEQVGRPSRLGLRVAADGGIYVTGAVIELGRGTLSV